MIKVKLCYFLKARVEEYANKHDAVAVLNEAVKLKVRFFNKCFHTSKMLRKNVTEQIILKCMFSFILFEMPINSYLYFILDYISY